MLKFMFWNGFSSLNMKMFCKPQKQISGYGSQLKQQQQISALLNNIIKSS
jgi:hypothetical protein